MKKLIISLLLSAVVVNACGMEAAKIAKYQCKLDMLRLANESKLALQKLANEYEFTKKQQADAVLKDIACVFGALAITWFGAMAIPPIWNSYLNHLERNAQNLQQANGSQKSNWGAYGKIATGLGLTALSAYLGMKQTQQPQSMVTEYVASGSSSADVGPTLSPNIMLNLSSAYTLAPMVPAYFFLRSGFKDLKNK